MLVAATIESAVGRCLYLHLNVAEVIAIFGVRSTISKLELITE